MTLSSALQTCTMQMDADGHRDYRAIYRVTSDFPIGPAIALQCPDLPLFGDIWNPLLSTLTVPDLDLWATRKINTSVRPVESPGPSRMWDVELLFSSKGDEKRCKDQQFDDPLLMPPEISGSQVKYTEEAAFDRFGNAIMNSAFQAVTGPKNEWDRNRPVIKIKQNVATSLQGYALPDLLMDCVNDAPLWGFAARCVKLSAAPWSLKFYGSCSYYYERTLEFHIQANGFDRDIADEGTKALAGHWNAKGQYVTEFIDGLPADSQNPSHFQAFKDRKSENTSVILNGHGVPAFAPVKFAVQETTGTSIFGQGNIHVEFYPSANFLLLGVPIVF